MRLPMIVLALFVPAPANADGVATWLYDVTTEDGDALVEPGESATVTLTLDMEPDVNYPDGPVLGFAASIFDVLGGANAEQGMISDWTIIGIDGIVETQLDHDLFGVTIAQSTGQDFFTPADPIELFAFTWTPVDFGPYSVMYSTDSHLMRVWEGTMDVHTPVDWVPIDVDIQFEVIPSPAAYLIVASIGVLIYSRTRI